MKTYKVRVNGKVYLVEVEEVRNGEAGRDESRSSAREFPLEPASSDTDRIEAPMQGTLIEIRVSAGEHVAKGQVIAVLDAMKMENDLASPFEGTVAEVPVRVGDTLNSGELIMTIRT